VFGAGLSLLTTVIQVSSSAESRTLGTRAVTRWSLNACNYRKAAYPIASIPNTVRTGRTGSNQASNAGQPKISIRTLLQVGHAMPRNPTMPPLQGARMRHRGTQKADVTPARAASMVVAANPQMPTGVMRLKNELAQTADTVPITTKRASATSVPRRLR